MLFRGAIAALALMVPWGAAAQTVDFSGDLSLQTRWYPESPAFSGQRNGSGGMVIEPTLYWDIAESASFTLTPLYRYDSADSRRTHADLREAYLLMYGDWGENAWELRLGVDRVFWGVVELHNLVDVVNQFDPHRTPARGSQAGPTDGVPDDLRRMGHGGMAGAPVPSQAHVSGVRRAFSRQPPAGR